MAVLKVAKLRAGTIYKLLAVGLLIGFLLLFTLFGILSAADLATMNWNGKPITGLKAVYLGPLIGVFMALVLTAIIGSVAAFGLWLYSMYKPMEIEYEKFDESGENK
jgi:Sec-independent protein secretion pathway component TatC